MKCLPLPLRQRRTQLLLSLAVLILALAVVVGSGAFFTSTSANPSNVFTAGNLSHSNNHDGAAILTGTLMKPGAVSTGTVTIANSGDIAGDFTLSWANRVDTPGPNGGVFSAVLNLRIYDQTTSTEVYNGKLNAMPASWALGTWVAGASHTYLFTVTFPDGGRPSGPTTGDNAYKRSSVTVDFNWEAITT